MVAQLLVLYGIKLVRAEEGSVTKRLVRY